MAYTNTSNKLIIRESPRLSGMVDSNHLSRLADESPQLFEDALYTAFTSMQLPSNPMRELTEGRGKVKILDGNTDTWKWKQAIRPRPAVILQNLESTSTPGLGNSYFKVKLDQDWFSPGEIITSNKEQFVRVSQQAVPYQESGGWVYTVELVTDSPSDFYDPALLAPGAEYVSVNGLYSEQASQATNLHFNGNIELQASLPDMIRLQHKVTGYVEDRVLTFSQYEWNNTTNTPIKLVGQKWISRAEILFWMEMDRQKDDFMFYGRGASSLDGEKGYKTRSHYGFKQQLEWGNVESYSSFTEKMLREYLMDLFIGRVAPENRNVTMLTGEYGMMLFDEAFKRSTGQFIMPADKVIGGTGMDLAYGYQFKRYNLINGGTVTLKRLPYADVNVTNTMRTANTGIPKESATFYILDLSGENQDNLWMVKHADSLHYGYKIGTRAPWPLKGSQISDLEDGYTMIARDRCGIHIRDVSATGMLKLKEN